MGLLIYEPKTNARLSWITLRHAATSMEPTMARAEE